MMNLINKMIKPVYAHCDIPCGVYEVDTMRNAAYTCLKMAQKLTELHPHASTDDHNNFIRMVGVKEQHAQVCKQQLYILWSDYFKPEHLEKFPDLHKAFWQAAKQCSKVKQSINADEAQKLVDAVAGIVTMFEESKK